MKRISNLVAWGVLAVVAALCVLNWPTFMQPAPLNLVLWQIEAPLGAVLLAATGLLLTLFLVAYLHNQIGSLLETRKLLKEIHRMQEVADKAEASRVETLQQFISTEFRKLNERIDSTTGITPAAPGDGGNKPLSLTELVARR